ncbi:hypothetical protein TCDM_12821 [Trypanosoma cruzi Dm28c]|uniref:Uncharacterized protein n=1 Tax=Trypanosoma cruzi Dm28c TaxID=1416333 RepID=V5A4L2_TRYCR|nr:hypothetical protein TCDM_12821 [Trypanosoma cruzi Dm28c]
MAALQPPSTVHVQGIGECVCCQQSARRSPFTWVGDAKQTAASYAQGIHREKKRKHGGSTQVRGTRVNINCTVRLAHRSPEVVTSLPHGARGLWLLWTEGMIRGKRGAMRSSSISVDCDASDALFSDSLQQRPSPSAAVGAFLLHEAPLHRRRHAHPPSKTQRGSAATRNRQQRVREEQTTMPMHISCGCRCVCLPTVTKEKKASEGTQPQWDVKKKITRDDRWNATLHGCPRCGNSQDIC